MLPLRKTTDTIKAVSTSDPAVKVKPKDRELPRWIPVSDVKFSKDATVVEIRPLTSSEVLLAQAATVAGSSPMEADLTIRAANLGTVAIKGPGLDVTDKDTIRETLDRFPPGDLATLGGLILQVTLLPPDPTVAAE